jgi:hypothetical protein
MKTVVSTSQLEFEVVNAVTVNISDAARSIANWD